MDIIVAIVVMRMIFGVCREIKEDRKLRLEALKEGHDIYVSSTGNRYVSNNKIAPAIHREYKKYELLRDRKK